VVPKDAVEIGSRSWSGGIRVSVRRGATQCVQGRSLSLRRRRRTEGSPGVGDDVGFIAAAKTHWLSSGRLKQPLLGRLEPPAHTPNCFLPRLPFNLALRAFGARNNRLSDRPGARSNPPRAGWFAPPLDIGSACADSESTTGRNRRCSTRGCRLCGAR